MNLIKHKTNRTIGRDNEQVNKNINSSYDDPSFNKNHEKKTQMGHHKSENDRLSKQSYCNEL